jgi:hypothetical protein
MRNKFKSERLTPGINTIMLDKDLVSRMCDKSKMLFGAKWRWRLMCGRNNVDPVELEKRFDTVIEQKQQQIQQIKERLANEHKQLGNDTTRENGDIGHTGSSDTGKRETTPEASPGHEARPGETNDGSSTTGSSE